MIVKIGNRFIDSNREPIMIILSDQEKNCIGDMDETQNKFLAFPVGSNIDTMREFMKGDEQIKNVLP